MEVELSSPAVYPDCVKWSEDFRVGVLTPSIVYICDPNGQQTHIKSNTIQENTQSSTEHYDESEQAFQKFWWSPKRKDKKSFIGILSRNKLFHIFVAGVSYKLYKTFESKILDADWINYNGFSFLFLLTNDSKLIALNESLDAVFSQDISKHIQNAQSIKCKSFDGKTISIICTALEKSFLSLHRFEISIETNVCLYHPNLIDGLESFHIAISKWIGNKYIFVTATKVYVINLIDLSVSIFVLNSDLCTPVGLVHLENDNIAVLDYTGCYNIVSLSEMSIQPETRSEIGYLFPKDETEANRNASFLGIDSFKGLLLASLSILDSSSSRPKLQIHLPSQTIDPSLRIQTQIDLYDRDILSVARFYQKHNSSLFKSPERSANSLFELQFMIAGQDLFTSEDFYSIRNQLRMLFFEKYLCVAESDKEKIHTLKRYFRWLKMSESGDFEQWIQSTCSLPESTQASILAIDFSDSICLHEKCPICSAGILFESIESAKCQSGHVLGIFH